MRFDPADLRLFLSVVETGSITAGAERAHLALASASARIKGMEEAIGTALLTRSRAGAAPTPAGEALAHHARLILDQTERMRGELARYGRGLKGHVRLWCNTAALGGHLHGDLAAFLTAHPDVDLDLSEQPSRQITLALAQGLIHLGIGSDAVDTRGLELSPYGEDRLVAVLPPGHALAERPAVRFAELLAEPFVGLPPGNAMQELVGRQALRTGAAPKYRVRVNSFEPVAEMVAAGVGVAVLPEAAALRLAAEGTLAVRPLDEPWTRRRLVLCVRSRAALPAFARELLEHLEARGTGPEDPNAP